ncbi:hypothetical protein ABZ805_05105 [Saccharopolyspora sp. NPDC047091]|uniref:non-homologous end-joining DNA ligase LigD n=1 Tax=Saccharopolyspora sp. NPDC047091 TaxID=3155924 RepID=UPI0033E6AE46
MTGTEALAAGDERIDLTHPDKVLYPADGYRKRDVAEYYRAVADRMVPHLRSRPLTLRRSPDGVGTGSRPGDRVRSFLGPVRGDPDRPLTVVDLDMSPDMGLVDSRVGGARGALGEDFQAVAPPTGHQRSR